MCCKKRGYSWMVCFLISSNMKRWHNTDKNIIGDKEHVRFGLNFRSLHETMFRKLVL